MRRVLRKDRTGHVTVELAIVLSFVLGPLIVGLIEMGRGIAVKQVLSDAARKGCRTAILPTGTTTDVTSDINQVLTDNNIDKSNATITILVNGAKADPSTSKQGDQISVKVGVPVSKIALVTPYFFPTTAIESDTLVMMRQQ